jgi:hypothetical protein
MMKLSESQLRKLIREMSNDVRVAAVRLPDDLRLNNNQQSMFNDILRHPHDGPLSALHWIEGQIDRRLTYDEIKQLIDLLNSNGWL